ncbi:MAG: branched-chain amino acid transaminase [Planctomycetes bacterium]|nr:branched-chain amino acid transaminase [Planctomycetota bacterium]
MAASFDPVPTEFQVPFAWLDGECVPAATAAVPLMSLTVHYGIGVFEGIRAYDGADGPAVFRLREHIARLFRSAALLRLEIPFAAAAIERGCTDVLARNGLRAGYLRPLVFVDDGKRGLGASNNRIRVAIATWPWGRYLGDEGVRNGIRAQVSTFARMSPRSFVPKGKVCGQYVNSVLAKRTAAAAGFDEAILLDDDGCVAEATGENLFLVRDGALCTPPPSQPILDGITRASVIELARELGLAVREERFARDTLLLADEVFLTGTAAEITPVREIDGHRIGGGTRGPVTERLQKVYLDAVHGRLPSRPEWRTRYDVRSDAAERSAR